MAPELPFVLYHRRAAVKSLNYSGFPSSIRKIRIPPPIAFLNRLQEATIMFANTESGSQEEEILLRDKSLAQSA